MRQHKDFLSRVWKLFLLSHYIMLFQVVYLYRDPQGDHIFEKSQKAIDMSVVNSQKTTNI